MAPTVAIIGAGFSGLGAGVEFKRRGIPFRIYEKADEVGGTWRDNHYPGLECDVPMYTYSFSYDGAAHWPRLLAKGPELQGHIIRLSSEVGVRDQIRFGSDVTEARWEDDRWHIATADGHEASADVLVQATGFLHQVRVPDIRGLGDFAGVWHHSARWDDATVTAGKRVGVLGMGSTGVQLVSELSRDSQHVTLFARNPQWIVPIPNLPVPGLLRRALGTARGLGVMRGVLTFAANRLVGEATMHPGRERDLVKWLCRWHLNTVEDPALRRALTPVDEPLCKRPVVSTRFYGAMQKPNVTFVRDGITRVVPEGVIAEEGRLHELDVLVLATGFHSHNYMRPMNVVGEDGATLDEAWADGPWAYRTLSVPGFPNMFMILGPHSPLSYIALHTSIEHQSRYVIQMLEVLRRRNVTSVSVRPEANERWKQEIRSGMNGTAWASGCGSWYVGPDGVPIQYPYAAKRWFATLRTPDLADYEIREADE